MSLKRIIMFASGPVALAAFASPAAAQGIPVFDSSSYLQALATVQHTATMIQQGEQQIRTATNTLASLQKLTNVNSIAPDPAPVAGSQHPAQHDDRCLDAPWWRSDEDRVAGRARLEHSVSIRAIAHVLF